MSKQTHSWQSAGSHRPAQTPSSTEEEPAAAAVLLRTSGAFHLSEQHLTDTSHGQKYVDTLCFVFVSTPDELFSIEVIHLRWKDMMLKRVSKLSSDQKMPCHSLLSTNGMFHICMLCLRTWTMRQWEGETVSVLMMRDNYCVLLINLLIMF